MKTFKILGLLLSYPQAQLIEARGEIVERLREEALLVEKTIKRIARFLDSKAEKDFLDVAEKYVETFDRGREHCLHLFEHIHGESRDRGQAMVDLCETYASKGLYIQNNELPDYLPLFMEYLSLCSVQEASDLLGEAIDVIVAIGTRLGKRNSPYAVVFTAIEALSTVKADHTKVKDVLESAPKDPQTWEELDEQWREAKAFGGDPLAATNCKACNPFANNTRRWEKSVGGSIK